MKLNYLNKLLEFGMVSLACIILFPISAMAQFGSGAQDAVTIQAITANEGSLPTPRDNNGHPDLSGFWTMPAGGSPEPDDALEVSDTGEDISPNFAALFGDGGPTEVDPTGEKPVLGMNNAQVNAMDAANAARRLADTLSRPSYKPEYQAQALENFNSGNLNDPTFSCGLTGVPRLGVPAEIVQTENAVYLMYENLVNRFRVIPTDGREHDPDVDSVPMGDAIGYWEDDTLVIDITNIADDTWLDGDGSFHSEDTHIVERFTRKGNMLLYSIIVEDPYFTEPFIPAPRALVLGDDDQHIGPEWACYEYSLPYMVNGDKH
jgi:hypothetical protein